MSDWPYPKITVRMMEAGQAAYSRASDGKADIAGINWAYRAMRRLEGVPAGLDLPSSAKPLPREHWVIERHDATSIAAAMHTNGGALYWTKFELADLPNDYIGAEDLKAIGIEPVDTAAAK